MTGTRIRGVIPRNPQRSDEERKAFGKRLTKHLADCSRNHFEVAYELGVHFQTVQEWMAGRRVPHPAKLKLLASYLGTTAEWLETGAFAAKPRRLSDIPGLYVVTRKVPGRRPWVTPPVPGTRKSLERALIAGCPTGTKFDFATVGAL